MLRVPLGSPLVFSPLALLLSAALAPADAVGAEPASELLALVPPSANVVLVADVEAIRNSPAAQERGWDGRRAFASGQSGVPPTTQRLLAAARASLTTNRRPDWKLVLLDLPQAPAPAMLARLSGGNVEQLAGAEVVTTPNGALLAVPTDGRVAAYAPADRQAAARWLRAAKSPGAPTVSEYLAGAVGRLDQFGELIFAVDLADTVAPSRVRDYLESEAGRAALGSRSAGAVAQAAADVRGATLSAKFGTTGVQGTLSVQFGGPASALGPAAKPLILAALESRGVVLDDMEAWEADLVGDAVLMSGPLEEATLRQITGLIAPPPVPASPPAEESPEDAKSRATQAYFADLDGLIGDLRDHNSARSDAIPRFTRGAEAIDELPVLNVDEDLLAYSAAVSSSLRHQADTRRMANMRAGVRSRTAYDDYDSSYSFSDAYDRYRYPNQRKDSVGIRQQEALGANDVRLSEWRQIDDGLRDLRRTLTGRYGVEF